MRSQLHTPTPYTTTVLNESDFDSCKEARPVKRQPLSATIKCFRRFMSEELKLLRHIVNCKTVRWESLFQKEKWKFGHRTHTHHFFMFLSPSNASFFWDCWRTDANKTASNTLPLLQRSTPLLTTHRLLVHDPYIRQQSYFPRSEKPNHLNRGGRDLLFIETVAWTYQALTTPRRFQSNQITLYYLVTITNSYEINGNITYRVFALNAHSK